MSNPTPIALATLASVVLCWIFFAGIFLLRKRPAKVTEAKRDSFASLGLFCRWLATSWFSFNLPGSHSCRLSQLFLESPGSCSEYL